MYTLNDQQIDFILNDIRARGVEIEDLQYNLLDHVCCIIEKDLETNGDFERFYQKTIKTFYKDALWEIEEETITLLIFKNYYAMKKIMILSGIFSVACMLFGIWFKYMHWPGAGLLLPLGILSGSLVFLPLLFTLKVKEQQNVKDKIVLAIGTLSAILLSLSFVFKLMGWPYSVEMLYASAGMTVLLFVPIYLFSGLKNPVTKINSIVTSLLILMGYTLIFSLLRTPQSERSFNLVLTHDYIRNEQILATERIQLEKQTRSDSSPTTSSAIGKRLNALCEEAKAQIIESQTGQKTISSDFEGKNTLLTDHYVDGDGTGIGKVLNEIRNLVTEYNSALSAGANKIPVKASFMQQGRFQHSRSIILLNEITQVQMILLQNQYALLASK